MARLVPRRVALLALCACACTNAVESPLVDASVESSRPPGPREECNGLDDDGDGKRDEGCPIRLTRTPGYDFEPNLHDGRLEWLAETGPTGAEAPGLFSMDLATSSWSRRDGVRGGYLYFDDEGHLASADFSGCYVLDLATGHQSEKLLISSAPNVFQQRCAVDGDYMVTTATIGVWSYYDVYYYRLSDGSVGSIPLPGDQNYAAIDDELILFNDRRDYSVWGYQIGSPRGAYRITEPQERGFDMGHRPIFRDGTLLFSHDCKVELYDAETTDLTFFAMRESLCNAVSFAFSDRFIVVVVDQKIRLIDRITGEDFAVTTYDREATDPTIDARWLVWRDDRDDQRELYGIDLSDFDDGDFFPEGLPP